MQNRGRASSSGAGHRAVAQVCSVHEPAASSAEFSPVSFFSGSFPYFVYHGHAVKPRGHFVFTADFSRAGSLS